MVGVGALEDAFLEGESRYEVDVRVEHGRICLEHDVDEGGQVVVGGGDRAAGALFLLLLLLVRAAAAVRIGERVQLVKRRRVRVVDCWRC